MSGFLGGSSSGGGGAPSGSAGGDLSSTYPNPTVAKINGATVPAAGALTTGNTLVVTGASAVSYAALNLAGGAGYVTGTLPNTNLPGATTGATGIVQLTGNLGGTSTSPTVVSLTGGAGVVNIAATGNILTWATATTAPGLKQADNITNSATAAALTIQAANATGTTATGGALFLKSGTGTTIAGAVNIQVGATTTLACTTTTQIDFSQLETFKYGTAATTDATPTTVASFGTATGSNYFVNGTLIGKDGSGNLATASISIGFKNVGGTLSFVGSPVSTVAFASNSDVALSTCAITLGVSGTNIVLQVAGVAATNISWTGKLKIMKV